MQDLMHTQDVKSGNQFLQLKIKFFRTLTILEQNKIEGKKSILNN